MAEPGELLLRQVQLGLQESVVVHRIVVGDDPPLDVREACEQARIRDRAMSPRYLGRVFVVGILRLVDQHVNVSQEVDDVAIRFDDVVVDRNVVRGPDIAL